VRDGCLALLLLMCFQTCKSLFAGRTCLFYVMSQLWSAGTKNVIDACIQLKVKRLIYTSSPSVVFDGVHGIFNGDESLAYSAKVLNSLSLNFIIARESSLLLLLLTASYNVIATQLLSIFYASYHILLSSFLWRGVI
jgi:hypothetical protein